MVRFLFRGLNKLLHPGQWRLEKIDLREHEEKVLLVLSLVISAIVGLTVVGFVAITERMSRILVSASGIERFLSPVAGSLVGGWLLYRYFPDARGSGIPQTRAALVLHRGVISLRTVLGKFLCSSISLGSGVALGREGPAVHIGAGIASVIGRRLGLSSGLVKSLIPVGTAAAVAAAFNTPLAAVLFTLEEILADLHARVVGSVVIGAATSWIVLRLLLGDEPLFHVPAYQLVHPLEFLIYALLGVLGGLASTAFVKLLLWQREAFLKVPERWKPYTPAVGGLVVGLLALGVPGVMGVGYNLVSSALNGEMTLKMMLLLLVLKMVATTNCYGSGNAGGIFGPSLFIGAMLGGSVGQVAHMLLPYHTGNAGAYALVGMGAAFAGIVRTPMTSVIMIFEVTRDYTIIVPLMIANLCSYALARKLQASPIYEALANQDGITMPSSDHREEPLTVERAMRPLALPEAADHSTAPLVHPDDLLDSALQRMGEADANEIQVVSRAGGAKIATLHLDDVFSAYRNPPAVEEARVTAQLRSWLPAAVALTVTAILLITGLVFWRQSHRAEMATEAFQKGEKLLALGQPNEAILEFRNALAITPQAANIRVRLGLVLVQTGHFAEAEAYLKEAVKVEPGNGAVWAGLAESALASGDKQQAQQTFRLALGKEWIPQDEWRRTRAQFAYANLLAEMRQRTEAVALLLSIIGQSGDDPATGKKAAEMVRSFGTPGQAEEAYAMLTRQFPADGGVWLRLGDARFAAEKDALALDAYRRAAKADPQSTEAEDGVLRTEEVLRMDPTRRGIPVRERARRWDEILQRILTSVAVCGPSPEIEKAKPLLSKRAASLEALDQKMEASLTIWRGARDNCKTDRVLGHILDKIHE